MEAFVEIAYRGLTIKCEPVYGANSEHTFFQQFKNIFNWTLSLKSFLLTLYIMVALVEKYQYGNEIDALGLLPKNISGWTLAFYCLRIGNCFVAFQSLQSCNLHLLEFFRYGPCFDHKLERGLVIESRINRLRYIISHFTVTSFFSNFATIFEWDELTWYAQIIFFISTILDFFNNSDWFCYDTNFVPLNRFEYYRLRLWEVCTMWIDMLLVLIIKVGFLAMPYLLLWLCLSCKLLMVCTHKCVTHQCDRNPCKYCSEIIKDRASIKYDPGTNARWEFLHAWFISKLMIKHLWILSFVGHSKEVLENGFLQEINKGTVRLSCDDEEGEGNYVDHAVQI